MNEELMTTGSTPGAAGFSGNAAATGPVAGFDPLLNKTLKKNFRRAYKKKKDIKEAHQFSKRTSRLRQYKVTLPTVGTTILYAGSPAELKAKMRMLLNPRHHGEIEIERIMPGDAAKYFYDRRNKHMRNIEESVEVPECVSDFRKRLLSD
jgi:hypothetical protein